jgi:hypothetical protein
MGEVFALEVDLCTAEMLTETAGMGDGGLAPDEGALQIGEFFEEIVVAHRLEIGFLQLLQSGHKRFGDKFATIGAKVTTFIGIGSIVNGGGLGCG